MNKNYNFYLALTHLSNFKRVKVKNLYFIGYQILKNYI